MYVFFIIYSLRTFGRINNKKIKENHKETEGKKEVVASCPPGPARLASAFRQGFMGTAAGELLSGALSATRSNRRPRAPPSWAGPLWILSLAPASFAWAPGRSYTSSGKKEARLWIELQTSRWILACLASRASVLQWF